MTNKEFKINLLTSAVLLYNIYRAAQSEEIGFTDTSNTLDTITNKLDMGCIYLSRDTLESSLWACNMLNELGLFWHPRGLTFREFLNKLNLGNTYNFTYNVIEEKKE